MSIQILILNYNGRHLLEECLPSVLLAAARSVQDCRVAVIDNSSVDDSVPWLAANHPEIETILCPNLGLCSFNEVVARLRGVAVLLNNDIKLDADCIDPWVAPLMDSGDPTCFMTAPLCRRFDGRSYEGFKTSVRWRFGLVQATALFAGHESVAGVADLTASAGAALAVDCRKFRELRGFDPLYLPGRLEDLDFAFRGYQAGYCARYVPQAVTYHLGMATFGAVFGREGCDRLALRNTLLFQWKNLRHPWHRAREAAGLAMRLAWEAWRAPRSAPGRRWMLLRALREARARWRQCGPCAMPRGANRAGELDYFRRFHPTRMRQLAPVDQ
jgi:N-acetylglucosaminyl-diphospho-decaprenol L-rhamnosyltransferase